MSLLSFESLSAYWSAPIVEANIIIFFKGIRIFRWVIAKFDLGLMDCYS